MIRVLHFVDYFLPETMNWIQRLVECTGPEYEHYFCAKYYHPSFESDVRLWTQTGWASTYPVPLGRKIMAKGLSYLRSRGLESKIWKEKIDIFHFHFGHVALEYMDLIKSFGDRSVVSLYGFDYEFLVFKKPEVKRKYKEMASMGVLFVTEGNYSSKLLESYNIPASRIRKVHMLFHPGKSNKIKPLGFPLILFQAASYSEKKGQDVLLKALGHCRNRDRFRLVLHGEIADREYFSYLIEIISRYDLRNVSLGPKISPVKYFRMLSESHFICNLSRRSKLHDTEGGIPVLLKDALCASKPVLSTFHCDIPDTIVHGYNGFLFQEDEDRAVTGCLDYLAGISPNEYAGLSFRAGESVRLKLNSGITAGELEDVYRLRI